MALCPTFAVLSDRLPGTLLLSQQHTSSQPQNITLQKQRSNDSAQTSAVRPQIFLGRDLRIGSFSLLPFLCALNQDTMAQGIVACCRALGRACTTSASCKQLPQIGGLVQPWVASDEGMLKHILSFTLTKAYGARIVADEWEVVPGLANLGRGDVVAELPCGAHLVVELKHLDTRTSGRTAISRRNRNRSYLAQQACAYGKIWQEKLLQQGDSRPVFYASFTNEKGLEYHHSASAAVDALDSATDAVMAVQQTLNKAGDLGDSGSKSGRIDSCIGGSRQSWPSYVWC